MICRQGDRSYLSAFQSAGIRGGLCVYAAGVPDRGHGKRRVQHGRCLFSSK